MSKEIILTKEQVSRELERIDNEMAVLQLKYTAYATGAMGIIKLFTIISPKSIPILKGSTMILGLAVPNYFTIIALLICITCIYKCIKS